MVGVVGSSPIAPTILLPPRFSPAAFSSRLLKRGARRSGFDLAANAAPSDTPRRVLRIPDCPSMRLWHQRITRIFGEKVPYPGSATRNVPYALSGYHDVCLGALRSGFESAASSCEAPGRAVALRAARRSRAVLALLRDVVDRGFEAVVCGAAPMVAEHSASRSANTNLARALRILKRDI